MDIVIYHRIRNGKTMMFHKSVNQCKKNIKERD